jgi:antirestriction protein ArdC
MAGINVYEIVTERILAALDNGVVPWRLPWRVSGSSGFPKNLVSGKEYRGINILLLGSQGYASPYWLTYKQAVARGGTVRKGEKSTPVVFWKVYDKNTVGKNGRLEKGFILRYYNVFNVSQCDNVDVPAPSSEKVKPTFSPIEMCEKIVLAYKTLPKIEHVGGRACYIPSFDKVCMPERESFEGREEYYSTLFHELVHSTGHESRLNRDGIMNPVRFGSHEYSFEELVAECGAAFLCAHAGILDHTLDNSAAYIDTWRKKLNKEPKWIVEASGKAAKAADYIMGDLLKSAEDVDTDEEAA